VSTSGATTPPEARRWLNHADSDSISPIIVKDEAVPTYPCRRASECPGWHGDYECLTIPNPSIHAGFSDSDHPSRAGRGGGIPPDER